MKVALFADAGVKAKIVSAPVGVVYASVPPDEQLHFEFDVRRWFTASDPDVTVILLPQFPAKTYAEFNLQLRGYTNVMMAAMGYTKSLHVLGAGTSLCRVLGELCRWLSADYGVRFVWHGHWRGDPVLAVEHVLETEEANTQSPEGAIQRGEVPDEVVPEQGCGEQYGPAPETLLEVPVAFAQAAPSGDVRAKCHSAAGKEAEGALHDYARPV
jgi:hypothetical protein